MAFSPSAEMGLTDIEMAHNFDIDDPYFDDRQYEMVYEVRKIRVFGERFTSALVRFGRDLWQLIFCLRRG